MIVVSNTTPLSSLLGIGRLDIVAELFGNVDISSAVATELEAGGHSILHSIIRIHSVALSDY